MHWVVEYEMSSSLGASLYLNAWATTFDGRRVPFGWFMSLSETNAEWCCLKRSSKSTTWRGVWRVRWLGVTSTIWTISTAPSGKDLLLIIYNQEKGQKKKHSKIRWWFPTPKKICVKLDHPFASRGDLKKKKGERNITKNPPCYSWLRWKVTNSAPAPAMLCAFGQGRTRNQSLGSSLKFVGSSCCGVGHLWCRSPVESL